ncbi:MAG: extracellular solute-binding protein, partial [Actinomycetota bacterium]|nr:extracellular solute-binding protein [Actinomycetota bacterium]
MRASISVVLAAAVVVTGVTACSSQGPGSGDAAATQGSNHLKFVAAEYSSATAPYWQKVAADFKTKTGITVDVQTIGWTDIHQQVSTMVQTNQLPDILNLDAFAQYAADGLLYPAADIETPALKANIAANLAASGDFQGSPYAIPFIGSSSALFYNPAVFAKVGITSPPTTTDELAADAKKIAATGTAGFAVSLSPEAPQIDLSMVTFNFGGAYTQGGAWTLNSTQNLAALTWLRGLADAKATEINPGKTGRVDGTWRLFTSGGAGMVIGESALADTLTKAGTPFKVVPFPAAPGSAPSALGVADYIMGFKKDGNQDSVRQFLDFVYAKQQYSTFVTNEKLLPVTTDGQAASASDPAVAPYIASLKSAKFVPVGQPGWDKVLGQLKNTVGLAMSEQSPKQVLDA